MDQANAGGREPLVHAPEASLQTRAQALRMRTHRGTETTCWEQARGGRFRAWSVAVCGAHAPRRAPLPAPRRTSNAVPRVSVATPVIRAELLPLDVLRCHAAIRLLHFMVRLWHSPLSSLSWFCCDPCCTDCCSDHVAPANRTRSAAGTQRSCGNAAPCIPRGLVAPSPAGGLRAEPSCSARAQTAGQRHPPRRRR